MNMTCKMGSLHYQNLSFHGLFSSKHYVFSSLLHFYAFFNFFQIFEDIFVTQQNKDCFLKYKAYLAADRSGHRDTKKIDRFLSVYT